MSRPSTAASGLRVIAYLLGLRQGAGSGWWPLNLPRSRWTAQAADPGGAFRMSRSAAGPRQSRFGMDSFDDETGWYLMFPGIAHEKGPPDSILACRCATFPVAASRGVECVR